MLFDADLHRGVCAMLLGARPAPGLRTMLETPEQIDTSFVERVAQPVAERLDVLAGEEDLADQLTFPPGGALQLSNALRRRYNFIVTDLPFTGQTLHHDLMQLAHQRVFVMPPTLAGIRDTLRLLAIPNGPAQPRRTIVVLNRAGMAGGLETRLIVKELQMTPDIVIPEIQIAAERTQNSDRPVVQESRPFRDAMQTLAREVGFNSREVGEKPAVSPWFWRRK